MILRQPIPDIRRHQERLITITTDKGLSHPGIVQNRPDDTVITRQPRGVAVVSGGRSSSSALSPTRSHDPWRRSRESGRADRRNRTLEIDDRSASSSPLPGYYLAWKSAAVTSTWWPVRPSTECVPVRVPGRASRRTGPGASAGLSMNEGLRFEPGPRRLTRTGQLARKSGGLRLSEVTLSPVRTEPRTEPLGARLATCSRSGGTARSSRDP
jgi:hypothetical protein